MKSDEFLKKIKPKKSLLIAGIVIIICAFASAAFIYFKTIKQEATNLYDVTKEDTYAKIDVELMTDYFAYEKENGYEKRMYLVMDDKYFYIATLSEKVRESLKEIYDYSMLDETKGVEKPKPVTIYGKAENIESWQINYLKDWLNGEDGAYTTEELNQMVGSFYIDTYENFEDEIVLLLVSLGTSTIIGAIFIILYLVRMKKFNKYLNTYGDEIEKISRELEEGSAVLNKNCKCILTDKFVVSYQTGLKMIEVNDIVWIYPFEYRQNGVVTQKSVYVITKNGKTNVIANTSAWGKKNRNAFEEFYQELMNKIPNALYGYSKENKEKAKELFTKKK